MEAKEDILSIIKWIVTTLLAAVPTFILFKRSKVDLEKEASESAKMTVESKKIETEVAESIMKSAGDLIDTYKDFILKMEERQLRLEEEVKQLKETIHSEVSKREKAELITKQLLIGVKRLTIQLVNLDITPVWEPEEEILKEIDHEIRH